MKTIINLLFSVLLFSFFGAKAQQIEWDKVNSTTIANMASNKSLDESFVTSSISNIMQIGNNNMVDMMMNSSSDVTIRQNGNYNTAIFDNSFTDKQTKTEINAVGDNNIVDITGTNSISKEMKINIQADNKTIFIRNY